MTDDGDDLVALADELAPGEAAGSAVPRDWSNLHKLLAQLPEGRWTTYGDLAERIGSAAIAVGQHVTRCGECQGAWRILGSDRRPREGFRWSDPTRSDSAAEALQGEGIRFDEHGRADPVQRMRWAAAN